MLIVVGMAQNKFTHVNINRSAWILVAQITQCPYNDVNQHIQIIGIEKLVARFVFENIQDDLLGGVNIFGTSLNIRSDVSILALKSFFNRIHFVTGNY